MEIKIIACRSVFEEALAVLETSNSSMTCSGLSAPTDAALLGRLDEAWDWIKKALGKAYDCGAEEAKQFFKEAWTNVEELITGAGVKAKELKDLILERLQLYQAKFIEGMLKQVRAEIIVGGGTLHLTQVQLSQKIAISGSLKASLAEVFNMTSNCEIQVNATYSTT
jgi:hypothetical protein